jgi:chromosomal replication initiator protein
MDQFGGAIGGAGGTAATNGRGAGQVAALRKGRDGGMEDQEALDLAADWADISQG